VNSEPDWKLWENNIASLCRESNARMQLSCYTQLPQPTSCNRNPVADPVARQLDYRSSVLVVAGYYSVLTQRASGGITRTSVRWVILQLVP